MRVVYIPGLDEVLKRIAGGNKTAGGSGGSDAAVASLERRVKALEDDGEAIAGILDEINGEVVA